MSTDQLATDRTDSTYGKNQQLLIEMADLVGHKWHTVILHQLLSDGPQRFSELKSAIDGISSKMLSESLATLEERRLLDRTMIEEKPVRVTYRLTERGHELGGVVGAMIEWGTTYLDAQTGTDHNADLPRPNPHNVHSGTEASHE